MILNTQIWQQTIEAAKAAASTSPAWLRAIDRAVIEIERSRYWSFADGVLTIISTISNNHAEGYLLGDLLRELATQSQAIRPIWSDLGTLAKYLSDQPLPTEFYD